MAFENVIAQFPFEAEEALSTGDYRFVKVGSTAKQVKICGAGEQMIGIRRNSPAINKPVDVVSVGSIAKLTIGSGGVLAGGHLKSGSAGEGIASTSDREEIGAIALEAGDENDVISVLVTKFQSSHA
jgi:hypothetical protein